MSERYILQIKTVPGEDFSLLAPDFRLVSLDQPYDEELLYAEVLPNVEGILATGPVDSELIAKCFRLKCIMVNGAGYDDIDVSAATAVRVPVYNIPDVTAHATAEMALALLLSVSRRVGEMNSRIRRDPAGAKELFKCGTNPGHTLEGQTIGIIGLGHIGLQFARMCSALRMNVIYTQRHQLDPMVERSLKWTSFNDLLAKSDVVSLHCPLTDETRGMMGESAFMRMKQGAILINTARGAIVDQVQLARFLEAGKLGGAGLDVFPNETEIEPKLLSMDNVVLTPHFGTNTVETRFAMADRMMRIIRAACNGESTVPGHLVNPDVQRRIAEHETPASDPNPDPAPDDPFRTTLF